MSEQTNKFHTDASFNHLIEVKNNGDALLTIHNDGTITAAEHLKPTETAAEVLRIMRETWMADAQSIKIRDQQERIKQLEESLESANTLLQLVMCEQNHLRDLRNKANDRIKRLEKALTEIDLAMKQPASNHRLMQIAGPARQVINIIKKAKEAKP